MLERIKRFILSDHLLAGNFDTILVAVSGGIDSCVLLDILARLKQEFKFTLVVIHFNHRTRGKVNLADEKFVKKLARKYKFRIITGRTARVPAHKNETTLRKERFTFYHKILQEYPQALLATGHTLNDQIETFIMRLSKGSRVRGLLGIRPRIDRLIHPMLRESRSSIVQYARERDLVFREDVTNYHTDILRNRIRHLVIPYLKKNLTPTIEQAIYRSLSDLNDQYQVYDQMLHQTIHRCIKKTENAVLLNRRLYLLCTDALRRGLLEYCISEVYPLNWVVSDRSLEQWDTFIQKAQSGKKKLFNHHEIALAEREYIYFGGLQLKFKSHGDLLLGDKTVLNKKESIHFSRVSKKELNFTANPNVEFIDGSKSGDKLLVRYWRRGDRFRPLGMTQDKKLSDFFIDLKLNRDLKQRIPLVCREDAIVWIGGYRLDDRFKVTESTKKFYRLELKTK